MSATDDRGTSTEGRGRRPHDDVRRALAAFSRSAPPVDADRVWRRISDQVAALDPSVSRRNGVPRDT